MKPVMYILMDPKLRMSTGKAAAQAAHAAVEAFRITPDSNTKRMWDCGGHYMKVVLQTDDLWNAKHYIEERGFTTKLILDEGRTEFTNDLTPTALGVEILDKDNSHVAETFSAFKLYKDQPRDPGVADFTSALSSSKSRYQRWMEVFSSK